MHHEATSTVTTTETNPPTRPDADELRLPVADGGYGPLDSDDIDDLIQSGHYPMPGTPGSNGH